MPAAAAAAEPTEQRRDGVAERYEFRQTMTKDGKRPLKHPKVIGKWRPHAAQPVLGPRNLEKIDGSRHARRPCALAKKAGKRRASELDWPDEFAIDGEWSEAEEMMPDEDEEGDTGWRAGPADREMPPFLGQPRGPTNTTWRSRTRRLRGKWRRARTRPRPRCRSRDAQRPSIPLVLRRVSPQPVDSGGPMAALARPGCPTRGMPARARAGTRRGHGPCPRGARAPPLREAGR